ncbi:topoisomerase IA-like protein [Bacillus sp. 3255]|uniref:hypothetical protein n=1 Tax=unclassified Paenibacillus TaxID=185978 RepID=UPI00237855DA|nr:hypothetical protein [Paenibacillus sp. MAHUQ-63]MDR6878577.1 topoisomerase IA-like protein [Bacillus sp. 3255]
MKAREQKSVLRSYGIDPEKSVMLKVGQFSPYPEEKLGNGLSVRKRLEWYEEEAAAGVREP